MNRQEIVLAGGCFWGMEDILRKVPGILDTEVGYCGGHLENPTYKQVCTGETGHAESLLVVFDAQVISLERILADYFFRMHDPTTLNRQGNDIGSQYRSVIFVRNESQRTASRLVIEAVNKSGLWPKSVVTTIEDFKRFYPAEQDHQDYLEKNPNGYTCHYLRTGPKIEIPHLP